MTAGSGQVKQWFHEARSGILSPAELFPLLAAQAPAYFSTFEQPHQEEGLPRASLVVKSGEAELVVLYTDRASAEPLLGENIHRLQSYPALHILQWLIRGGTEGVVINPGSGDLALDQTQLRLLFREYALLELGREGGAWVPTKDDSLMVLEVVEGLYTIPVYLTEDDAKHIASRTGSQAQLHPWSRIHQRSLESGTDGVFLQYGFREQAGLPRSLVTRLTGQVSPDPLELVEHAIAEGQGMLTPGDIWPTLAMLDRIWTLVDQDGDIVKVGPTLDFFTSLGAVEAFREQIRAQHGDLPVFPRFLPAQPLFRVVADKGLQMSINRGMENCWVDEIQGLPAIIGLAAAGATEVSCDCEVSLKENRRSWFQRIFKKR